MKIVLSVAFAAACAFAQSAETTDVPRLLAERGIKSATEFASAYQAFQDAVAAIPAATAEMEQAITCTKKSARMTAVCEDSEFETAIKHFQAARFNLRRSHDRTSDALRTTLLQIFARSFETRDDRRFDFSNQEALAARCYFKAAQEGLDHRFPSAERQWQKTWRRVEKVIGRRLRLHHLIK